MKYYMYAEPVNAQSSEPIYIIMSETAVLEDCWPAWKKRAIENISSHTWVDFELKDSAVQVSELREQMIDEWCAVHWAIELTPESLDKLFFSEKSDGQ